MLKEGEELRDFSNTIEWTLDDLSQANPDDTSYIEADDTIFRIGSVHAEYTKAHFFQDIGYFLIILLESFQRKDRDAYTFAYQPDSTSLTAYLLPTERVRARDNAQLISYALQSENVTISSTPAEKKEVLTNFFSHFLSSNGSEIQEMNPDYIARLKQVLRLMSERKAVHITMTLYNILVNSFETAHKNKN